MATVQQPSPSPCLPWAARTHRSPCSPKNKGSYSLNSRKFCVSTAGPPRTYRPQPDIPQGTMVSPLICGGFCPSRQVCHGNKFRSSSSFLSSEQSKVRFEGRPTLQAVLSGLDKGPESQLGNPEVKSLELFSPSLCRVTVE